MEQLLRRTPSNNQIQNPFPYIREVKDAAQKTASIQKELFVLKAKLSASSQIGKMKFGILALLFFNICGALGLFWISYALHEAGWSPWVLALIFLFFFGAIAAGAESQWRKLRGEFFS